jgi:uncharacterized protein YbjT (DUF2867 family)
MCRPRIGVDLMKIVVLGAAGNTGSVVADKLLERGDCTVRVVGRTAEALERFARRGAEVCVASVKDKEAMASAFEGAHAAYTMIPPDRPAQKSGRPVSPVPASADHYAQITETLSGALRVSGVRQVVNLSALHAHVPERSAYLADFFRWEKALDAIPDMNVTHLRPGFFMEGLYDWIAGIKSEGRTTNLFPPDLPLPFIAAGDVGAFAASVMMAPSPGIARLELLGNRDISMREATKIIGQAIGLPALQYVQLSFDQAVEELVRRDVPRELAIRRYEMRAGVNAGTIRPQEKRTRLNTTPTSFESFVQNNFIPAFNGRQADSASQERS